jgi:predicted ATPase
VKVKLTSIKLNGVPGHGEINLTDINRLSVFTGPNGSGKSTALNAIKLALEILHAGGVHDTFKSDKEITFSEASLSFTCPGRTYTSNTAALFKSGIQNISIKLLRDADTYSIVSVSSQESLFLETIEHTTADIKAQHDQIKSMEIEESNIRANIAKKRAAGDTGARDSEVLLQRKIDERELQTNLYDESLILKARMNETSEEIDIPRSDFEKFIRELKFPSIVYLDAGKFMQDAVPALMEKLVTLKKGDKEDNKKFQTIQSKLEHLLQHDFDCFNENNINQLKINGIPYQYASSGTQVSLAYFGHTDSTNSDAIIIWDEPENGLHPTRRIRLLDLMMQDGRQFFIATHALEFAPVFYPDGKVYRCESNFFPERANGQRLELSVSHIAKRMDAFLTLEALGVQPARTLFTANIIIWVEGPSELIFYRHWLRAIFKDTDIHEGYHYTLMQYGGGLISYLGIAEPEEIEGYFDVLSMCRNPVFLVDSDFSCEPAGSSPTESLKTGAFKIFEEIQKLNDTSPDSALFLYTQGREVENYFPEQALWYAVSKVWQDFAENQPKLNTSLWEFGKYENYFTSLEAHFIKHEVTFTNSKGEIKASGISRWGKANKVEMIRAALETPNLNKETMKWHFSSHLDELVSFIKKITMK